MDKIITQLITKQKSEQLSDAAFARKLEVNRRLFGRTKSGEIPIGITLLKAIVRTYPELCIDVLNFLRNEHGANEE